MKVLLFQHEIILNQSRLQPDRQDYMLPCWSFRLHVSSLAIPPPVTR
jgi:hypothetical protein